MKKKKNIVIIRGFTESGERRSFYERKFAFFPKPLKSGQWVFFKNYLRKIN